jgi:CubicO group peptidase (beta-lactamase class C family)
MSLHRALARNWAAPVAALWLLAAATAAAAGHAADTASAPFSRQGLASLDAFLQTAVRDRRAPSAIAMLARDGEVLWLGTAGEMGPGVPMRDDAIIPLASVGKMYTATAAMILVERGIIGLDDPVARYIPEFASLRVAGQQPDGTTALVAPLRPVTVRHLLTHTTGLTVSGDAFWAAWDANSERTTTTTMARSLAALPLRAHPGDRFEYGPTGASYEVLGAVIEIASGRTLEDFMIAEIFEPLGLDETHFYLPPAQLGRLPAFYREVDGELRPDRARGEDFPRSSYFHGGGGVQSSPRDILRFARLFLDGGAVDGVRLLQPATVRMMMSDQLGERAPAAYSWGFGAAVLPSPAGGSPLYGWTGGGYATLWVDPAARLVAYFAFPVMPPGDNDLLREFRRLVYAVLARD